MSYQQAPVVTIRLALWDPMSLVSGDGVQLGGEDKSSLDRSGGANTSTYPPSLLWNTGEAAGMLFQANWKLH